MGPVIIETERLLMRGWTTEDVPVVQELMSHPSVSRFINQGKPTTDEAAAAFVVRMDRTKRERGWCRWALELKETPDRLAGFCGVGCTFAPEVELGWTLRHDLWGRGLATEAAQAALAYCFETVGFARIISSIDPRNHRSAAVAERLGMVQDGTIPFEGNELLRYAIDNPDPEPGPRPGFVADCVGEAPGRSGAISESD